MSKIKFYGTMTRNNVEKKKGKKKERKKGKKKKGSSFDDDRSGDGSGVFFLEARVW